MPLNPTSRGIHKWEQCCAKGLSIYLAGSGHREDGRGRRERYWQLLHKWWVCVLAAEAMEKEIVVLYISDRGHPVQKRWPRVRLVNPWNMALMAHLKPMIITRLSCVVHGLVPFKCMRAPLKASIKKIKGHCIFVCVCACVCVCFRDSVLAT